MTVFPALVPVTIPALLTVAMAGLADDHVPDGEDVLCNERVLPAQTL